jgi:hypothetical protein
MRVDDDALEHARVLEVGQTLGKRPGRDPSAGVPELVEADRPFVRGPENRDRPAALE